MLAERRHEKAGVLSGGEQQMLALVRALMSRPKLLLLDEPSMGLAPLMVERVFDNVREIAASGVTILLVEQNARLALEISQRAYVLQNGEMAMSGPAAELMSSELVKEPTWERDDHQPDDQRVCRRPAVPDGKHPAGLGHGRSRRRTTAQLLVETDLRAIDSHGVSMLPMYEGLLKQGTLNMRPQRRVLRDTPVIALIDGDHGLGHPIAREGDAAGVRQGARQRHGGGRVCATRITSAPPACMRRWPRSRA